MQNHRKLTMISMVHEKNVQNQAGFSKKSFNKAKEEREI